MSKRSVLWVKRTNLSEEAVKALKEVLGEIELFQLKDFEEDLQLQSEKFSSVDIIAFQKGSLPPELEGECVRRPHIIHEIDSDFNFTRWTLPK